MNKIATVIIAACSLLVATVFSATYNNCALFSSTSFIQMSTLEWSIEGQTLRARATFNVGPGYGWVSIGIKNDNAPKMPGSFIKVAGYDHSSEIFSGEMNATANGRPAASSKAARRSPLSTRFAHTFTRIDNDTATLTIEGALDAAYDGDLEIKDRDVSVLLAYRYGDTVASNITTFKKHNWYIRSEINFMAATNTCPGFLTPPGASNDVTSDSNTTTFKALATWFTGLLFLVLFASL